MAQIALAAGFSVLFILVGHWFPWRPLLGRDLHRLEAYVYGTLAIFIPAGVVLWVRGDYCAIAIVAVCAIVAGAATALAKAIDLAIQVWREVSDRRTNDG